MQVRKWWYIADKSVFIESECPINALSPGAFEYSFQEPSPPPFIDLVMQEQNRAWKTYCKRRFYTESEVFENIRSIALALAHLHDSGVTHRDIHPQRFQLFPVTPAHIRNEGDIQAASFAPSILKFNSIGLPFNFKKLLKRENFSGHVNYSPPELIMENQQFSSKVDVWSFGCCIYYMINKKDPFDGRNPSETKNNILNLRTDKNMNLYEFIKQRVSSPLLKYFLESCLNFKPEMRPSFAQIIDLIDRDFPQFKQMSPSM